MNIKYYLDRQENNYGYDLDRLWRIQVVDRGFSLSTLVSFYLDITDFMDCDYNIISMLHPDISNDKWIRILEVAKELDTSSESLAYKYIFP